jgi:3-oxoacyl-[acyl-carrier-protein] synthase-1
MPPLAVIASGMVTGVGLSAPASCAAMRCAIDSFGETRYMDGGGEWIIGSQVPLEGGPCGLARLVQMVAPAIRECLSGVQGISPEEIPLLLCVAEKQRPGRTDGLDDEILDELQAELGFRLHPRSAIIAQGRVGGVVALNRVRDLIQGEHLPQCLIAGVDSFVAAPTLAAFEDANRLLTSQNSNGFIPGEAGAAVLIAPGREQPERELLCLGIGFGTEKATVDSELPLRADGMAEAIFAAIDDARCGYERLDYRICDANGEQYRFKEASLALARTMRILKCVHELWHVADCIGEIGAAVVPCSLGVARAAAAKGYAPGKGVLCHFGNDDEARAAIVLRFSRHGGG